jgi:tetratricopeptide (TPR) repeat protein
MNKIDLIDKYFSNSLSPKEQLEFNKLLRSDEKFKKEFSFQKDLQKAIYRNQRTDLKKVLQNFEQNKSVVKLFNSSKKWLAAASILLIIGFGFIYINNNVFPSPDELFVQNYEPYRNIVLPIERGDNSNTIVHSAFVAYENENYHKAINLFNSVPNKNEPYILFYKSMCYMSLNRTGDAISLLKTIAWSDDDPNSENNFKELANWYLALAYLKLNENEQARKQFSIIANDTDDVYKKEDSRQILKHLN